MGLMDNTPTRITVNDREQAVRAETNVAELLELLQLQPKFLAVELNRRVVARADHRATVLSPGDRVEIVTLVGGG